MCGGAEIFLRLFDPFLRAQSPSYYYRTYAKNLTVPDERLIRRGSSNASALIENSEGIFVKYELSEAGWREQTQRSSAKQLLVIGDAFTFGTGVDLSETYAEFLSKDLNIEVLNRSVMGWAPDQYYLFIKDLYKKNRYSAIILQLSNNDLGDMEEHIWLNADGEEIRGNFLPEKIISKGDDLLFSSPSELVNLFLYFRAIYLRKSPDSLAMKQALDRLVLCLEATYKILQSTETPMILIMASDWGQNSYGKEWGKKYQESVREFAHKNHIPLLEPHAQFAWQDYLTFPDLHWKPATHRKVAKVLEMVLQRFRLINPPPPNPQF